MAAPTYWPAGFLGNAQDGSVQLGQDIVMSPAIFVDFATGNDANAGTLPELPVKTIAQAHTNVAVGGVVNIFATHNEPTAGALACNKAGVLYRGYGTGSARSQFTPASGAAAVFAVSAQGVRFDNILLKAAAATPGSGGRISTTASDTEIKRCDFECGASDQDAIIVTTSDRCRIDTCTFTAIALRPSRAINVAANHVDVKVVDCIIDGSTFGWAANAIIAPTNGTRFIIENLTLAGKSDLQGTTVTTYQMLNVRVSGAGSVNVT